MAMDRLDSIVSVAHLVTAARLLVSAALLLAGVTKFVELADFRRVVAALPFIPSQAARGTAIAVPTIELLIGAWLAIGRREAHLAAVTAAILFAIFGIVLAAILLQGHRLECGCFGRFSREQVTWATVVRSVVLAILAALAAREFDAEPDSFSTGLPVLLLMLAGIAIVLVGAAILDTLRAQPLRHAAITPASDPRKAGGHST